MKGKNNSQYQFLIDPHLYYYLQSPNKLNDLLKTNKYVLQDNKLVQIGTNQHLIIDNFVLARVVPAKKRIINSQNNSFSMHKTSHFQKTDKEKRKKKNKEVKKEQELPKIKGFFQFKRKIL